LTAPTPAIERDARISVVGRRAVLEALAAPEVSVERVRLARGAPASLRGEVQRACREHSVPCEIGSVARLRELADEPRHDQGVAARIVLHGVEDVAALARDPTPRAHWLALDGLTNPANVGMIARSAAASGIDGILWPRTGTPWLNGLIVKASASAVLRCRIARCDALADGLERLRQTGFRIIGLAAREGEDLFVAPVPERAVYVIGSETEGLSRPVARCLDARVRIPIHQRVDSLNAAVSAALVCFHVSNSHRQAPRAPSSR
jgi:23S rRNA (guanosine2251-2'-O)-methyltransferase